MFGLIFDFIFVSHAPKMKVIIKIKQVLRPDGSKSSGRMVFLRDVGSIFLSSGYTIIVVGFCQDIFLAQSLDWEYQNGRSNSD